MIDFGADLASATDGVGRVSPARGFEGAGGAVRVAEVAFPEAFGVCTFALCPHAVVNQTRAARLKTNHVDTATWCLKPPARFVARRFGVILDSLLTDVRYRKTQIWRRRDLLENPSAAAEKDSIR